MRQRNKRNIVIGLLCVMVVFMSVGYAVLSQNLTIGGTGNINGSWKIEITSISPQNINEGESISTSIADSKVVGSFAANLKKPTDAVIYTVTVENKGTIDAVLDRVTPEDYAQGDIKYTTTGKEECKNLDAGATCDFTIKVEYLDTGAGQVPTPNGTEVKQEFTIKYVQEGANVNTPGGSSGGEIDNTPAITVDSNGLVTGYNREKLTNDEGYVVIPATTETGEEIVSIDENSFLEYNVAWVYVYNETTGEEIEAYVIYDEENYDEIKSMVMADMEGSGSGSGSYSSNSYVLDKDISPTNLTANYNKSLTLEKLSGSGSGSSEPPKIYSKIEFEELLKQISSTGKAITEYECRYANLETGEIEEVVSKVEKLDLTQAIYLKMIGEYAFRYSSLREVKLGNTVEIIDDEAFACTNLTTVTIPSSVKEIRGSKDGGAFHDSQISTLIFEENSNLTTIGRETFANNQISELILPSNIKTIEISAFRGNQISGIFTIPANVETIESSAFSGNQISKIIVEDTAERPSKLTEFSGFDNNQINKLIVPANVTQVSGFSSSQIKEVIFEDTEEKPSQLVTIQGWTFENNDINDEVIIPASVTTIGRSAFGYNKISSLIFEDTEEEASRLTRIDMDAFSSNQISKLTIPSSVTTIGDSAFRNNNIVDLSILSKNVTFPSNTFEGSNNLLTTVYINMKNIQVPSSLDAASYSNMFGNIRTIENLTIGADVETIISKKDGIVYHGAFSGKGIKKLIFEDTAERPSKLTIIDPYTFSSNQISEVIIPSSVTTIGTSAFGGGGNSYLSKIIIKRSDSTGMTLASGWSGDAQVVYDPNYAG